MNIKDLIEHPINPRVIRDSRFKDLVKSILELPGGLRYNRIKYNPKSNEVIAGNMRSRALRYIHNSEDLDDIVPENPTSTMTREEIIEYFTEFKESGELPDDWVEPITDMSDREMLEFMIKDNLQFGETDWEILKDEWADKVDLVGLGFEDAAWLDEDLGLEEIFGAEDEYGYNTEAPKRNIKQIQLFYDTDTAELFKDMDKDLRERLEVDNVSDMVLHCVKKVYENS